MHENLHGRFKAALCQNNHTNPSLPRSWTELGWQVNFQDRPARSQSEGDLNGRILFNVGPLRAGTDASGNAFCKPAAVAEQPCQQKGRVHKRT